MACRNDSVTESIIRLLVKYFPDAPNVSFEDGFGKIMIGPTALHEMCENSAVTPNIIQFLIDRAPDSLRVKDWRGRLPLHRLCEDDRFVNDRTSIDILRILLKHHPESIKRKTYRGSLPLHLAVGVRSTDFCRILIDAYPDSVRNANLGDLPIHYLCNNDNVGEKTALRTLKLLLEKNPESIKTANEYERNLPLHCASRVQSPKFCSMLIDVNPESVRIANDEGNLPIHLLCSSEKSKVSTLKLLVEKNPESIRLGNNRGYLPLHFASRVHSPIICKVLIDAYRGSQRISNVNGELPLHLACDQNTLATVEYLLKMYPDAVNHSSGNGYYPIHCAVMSLAKRKDPAAAADIVQFLLNSGVKLQKIRGESLLLWACGQICEDSKAGVQIIKAIYDAHADDNDLASQDKIFVSQKICRLKAESLSHKLLQFCDSESLSEEGLRNLVKEHGLTVPDNSNNISSYSEDSKNELFDERTIRNLISIATDNWGLTALHLACGNKNVTSKIIQLLIDLIPDSVRSETDGGRLPLHVLCTSVVVEEVAMEVLTILL